MDDQDNNPFASGTVFAQGGTAIAASGVVPVQRLVDDGWRRWIAENLLLGSSRDSMLSSMIAGGLPPAESAAEIDLALRSPYLKAVERMGNRLKKREWMLASYRKMNRLRPGSEEIERRHKLSRATPSSGTIIVPIAPSSSRA